MWHHLRVTPCNTRHIQTTRSKGNPAPKPNTSGQGHTEGCDPRDPAMPGVAQPSREQDSSASPQNHPNFGCAPDTGHVRRAVGGEQHPSQPGSKHSGGVLGSPSQRELLSLGGRLRAAGRLTWRRPPPRPPHAPGGCRTPLRTSGGGSGRPRRGSRHRGRRRKRRRRWRRRRCRRSHHQQRRRRAPGRLDSALPRADAAQVRGAGRRCLNSGGG